MPGMAVETTSSTPERARRLETRRSPWSSRYSIRASSGVSRLARIHQDAVTARRVLPPRASTDLLVAEVLALPEGGGDPGLALELHDEDRFADAGCHRGERRAHCRLADATLARDDEDVALCAEGPHVHAGLSVVPGLAD